MKRMLINAAQPEEVRIALVDGQKLYDFDIEGRDREQKKDSIYKAKITSIEPSLGAAFVDIGASRHGFLPLKDITPQYLKETGGDHSSQIEDMVKKGQELVVQVVKEERGTKGAAVTAYVRLAGRYLVLLPNNPRGGGVSRRIEGDHRGELREVLSQLDIPQGMSLIVRTAGMGRSTDELQWDLDYLLQLWKAIQSAGEREKAPKLLYQNDVILRSIRDNLHKDVGELLIDNREAYEQACSFINDAMPHYKDRTKYYDEAVPLFSRFHLESQIENAFKHTVKLPSGGSIVIDPTEALVSIDINSARATKGADIEETALTTNLEAAEEVARQLRLRDIGGLIVIDFIDMSNMKNQRAVESRMREALEQDRARVQVGPISRFGLMEMSRQRLRPSLVELTTEVCPRCSGQGRIRDIKSLALAILRVMEEESLKQRSSMVRALVPLNIASYLLNEKRQDVADIERRTETHIVIVPNVNMETPQYEVQRIRDDRVVSEIDVPSYELTEITNPTIEETSKGNTSRPEQERAVVQPLQPASPAPVPTPQQTGRGEKQRGVLKKIMTSLFSEGSAKAQPSSGETQGRRSGGKASSSERRGKSSNRKTSYLRRQRTDTSEQQDEPRGKPAKKQPGDSNRSSEQARSGQDARRRSGERKGAKKSGDKARKKGATTNQEAKSGKPPKPKRTKQGGREEKQEEKKGEKKRAASPDEGAAPEHLKDRKPSDDALAQSKRRPRRNRGRIAEQTDSGRRSRDVPKDSEPKAAASTKESPAPAADEPADKAAKHTAETPKNDAATGERPEPKTAPASASSEPPSQEQSSQEPPPQKQTAPQANDSPKDAAAQRPRRAANDPREIRRRQQEAALSVAESGKT